MEEKLNRKRELDDPTGISDPLTAEENDESPQRAEDYNDEKEDLSDETKQKTVNSQEETEKMEVTEKERNGKEVIGDEYDEDETTLKITDLPDVPMRMILKMLKSRGDDEDRPNKTLRLVSKSMKRIVDKHVELLWMVHYPFYFDINSMLQDSDKNIHLSYQCIGKVREGHKRDLISFAQRYSQKIVSFNGNQFAFEYLVERQTLPKLERVSIMKMSSEEFTLTNTLLSKLHNVKELFLSSINLNISRDVELPRLEVLNLNEMKFENDSLPSLLSSCSASLQSLEMTGYCIDSSSIRNHDIQMRKLKRVKVNCEMMKDPVALLSICSQAVESIDIDQSWNFDNDEDGLLLSGNFPRLKCLRLCGVIMKQFLPLLSSSQALEEVKLTYVDFTSVIRVQYDVTSIKDLRIRISEADEDNFAAMFEFLCKWAARTGCMEVNRKRVDHNHLMPGNFALFKETFKRLKKQELNFDQIIFGTSSDSEDIDDLFN